MTRTQRTGHRRGGLGAVVAAVLGAALLPGVAAAQMVPAPPPLKLPGQKDNQTPLPKELEGVDIVEQLNGQVPLDLEFVDAGGQTVRLGDYLDGDKPVLLNLGYFNCPMLCGLVWQGMVDSLKELSWTPGQEFEVLTVSFDPNEGPELAQRKKQTLVEGIGRPSAAAGWHVLTGQEPQIRALTEAVGFNYEWVEQRGEFAHTAAIVLLTPDGRVSRYLYGVKFPPQRLRLSLVEASEGKAGSTADRILLYCFHYDPEAGQYTAQVMNIMRLGGVLTLLVLVVAIGGMLIREALKRRAQAEAATPG